jgi:two-component system phosphate regulon sensor histidine kinase PhoR
MEFLVVILAIGLLAALMWAFRLQQRIVEMQPPPPPPPELFSPLFQAVVAEFDAGILIVDEDRCVQFMNAPAEVLLGVNHEKARGATLITLLRDHEVDTLVSDVQRDGEAREMGFQPIGGERRLRLHVSRFSVYDSNGTIVQLRDVTQIGMLERARRDLVANVSHELRNPLASVKLLVETLQSEPPPAISRRMLSQMAQEVDAITQLVDELHELAQIESGRVALHLGPVALAPVVTNTLERIYPQAEREGLRVSAYVSPELPPVLIDPPRIGQVLLNLLHNAIKFTPGKGQIVVRALLLTVVPEQPGRGIVRQDQAGGPVVLTPVEQRQWTTSAFQADEMTIELSQELASGDWLLVTITDTGVGIPASDLPRIFERFYKVDRARTRNAGGTGLGLAIAKHLIEGHGGRIWATSIEGDGSTFHFVLPVA